jgi:hypothetical protein
MNRTECKINRNQAQTKNDTKNKTIQYYSSYLVLKNLHAFFDELGNGVMS